MQTFDNQLHKGTFGLITAFFWGLFLAEQSSKTMIDMVLNHEWGYLIEAVINFLIGGGLSFIGGLVVKTLWEKIKK